MPQGRTDSSRTTIYDHFAPRADRHPNRNLCGRWRSFLRRLGSLSLRSSLRAKGRGAICGIRRGTRCRGCRGRAIWCQRTASDRHPSRWSSRCGCGARTQRTRRTGLSARCGVLAGIRRLRRHRFGPSTRRGLRRSRRIWCRLGAQAIIGARFRRRRVPRPRRCRRRRARR